MGGDSFEPRGFVALQQLLSRSEERQRCGSLG